MELEGINITPIYEGERIIGVSIKSPKGKEIQSILYDNSDRTEEVTFMFDKQIS